MAPPLPSGSSQIQQYAAARGGRYDASPDEAWFRAWEPYDTIAPPSRYLNAVTWPAAPGVLIVVEPWYALDDLEPLERTVLGFATHPALRRRAAMRVGEHHLTRVAFFESPPPPNVKLGDALWDRHVTTFAASPSEAAAAFHPRLRSLLAGWGYEGHLELRPGGLVAHYAGLRPTPPGYDRMARILQDLVRAAIAHG